VKEALPADAMKADDRSDVPWIRRWAPERNMIEVGAFGGLFVPSRRLELFEADEDRPVQGFRPFARVAPDFGLRAGYYPIRFLGLELEGAVMPTTEAQYDQNATIWAFRGHIVGQIGLWSVTPFVLAGPSAIGVASNRTAVGNDVDAGFHFGGGAKFYVHRYLAVRLDLRDTLSARRGVADGVIHNFEALLGVTVTLGRKKAAPGPKDTDGDGIFDPDDKCVDVPGVPEYQGCPIPDTDGDGVLDPDDKCVDVPGLKEYQGCPAPDTDGDGILDPDDECVDVPGVPEYKGCPIPDTDGDGILDPDDACPKEPETMNGFEDEDGCPDDAPDTGAFTGVIEGIFFDVDQATIKKTAAPKLDAAIETLKKHPSMRIEISGHTDSKGNDAYNVDLSQRRAEAVKQYMVERGIDASRIQTRGAGENEPIASNSTRAGRAQNRRIEFKLL
jgi:outer membrane protein OmpA-like peptidoglycan-associated protein